MAPNRNQCLVNFPGVREGLGNSMAQTITGRVSFRLEVEGASWRRVQKNTTATVVYSSLCLGLLAVRYGVHDGVTIPAADVSISRPSVSEISPGGH